MLLRNGKGCYRNLYEKREYEKREYEMKETAIYLIRTDTVRNTDCTLLADRMPVRMEKAMRFRFERDRLLCLGAGLLMMEAMGIQNEQEILYGAYGKPYVPGLRAFNISHSGSCCILACGDVQNIGVDIEVIKEKHIDLAPKVFTGEEVTWMNEDPINRFFHLWTWKESVMKAAGMGLRLAPRSFEVLPFTEGKPARILDQNWYAQKEKTDNSCISICADEPIGQPRLIELKVKKRHLSAVVQPWFT